MGLAQKAFGDLFEEIFFNACSLTPGMASTRFPDGCRVVGKNKLIRIKTPCDWVLTYKGRTALIDTKTTETNSFPHSKICPHQTNEMFRHAQAGSSSGYVIWFRDSDEVYFMSSLYLNELKNTRGSIKHYDNHNQIFLGNSRKIDPRMIFGINLDG